MADANREEHGNIEEGQPPGQNDEQGDIEEGQPPGQNDGHGRIRAFARWPKPDDVLTKQFKEKAKMLFSDEEWKKIGPKVAKWHHIFVISCVCAVLIDPLFSYIFLMDDDKKCVKTDGQFRILYIIIRSITDIFYFIDLVLKGVLIHVAYGKAMKSFKYRFARSLRFYIVPLLFICLPIPQVILLVLTSSNRMDAILILAPIQYELRVFLIYGLLRLRRNRTGLRGWVKRVLIIFPFILAAHLFGSGWYYLALSRLRSCWQDACKKTNGCHLGTNYQTICSDGNVRFKSINTTVLAKINEFCPINPENATIYDFGIYLNALQSNMTRSKNVSDMGSTKFKTSVYGVEIMFAVTVSIGGVALFSLYFSEMRQALIARSQELRLRRTARTMHPEVDLWLKEMELPKDLKATIMKQIRKKLRQNKDVDRKNFLSILPTEKRRDIMRNQRLTCLTKVPKFKILDERVLKAISNHLMPVVYPEDSYIMREGETLDRVLFITQGRAWLYAASGTASSSSSSSATNTIKFLEKGDFYGEELIDWFLSKSASFSEFPISTRNVKAHTKVEGFVLRANDLHNVQDNFWWCLYKGQLDSLHQLERFHNLAAFSIQRIWRECLNTTNRSVIRRA